MAPLSTHLEQIFPYIAIATGAGIAGGLVAMIWVPAIRARSAVQHFAAGAVIAAVASDVIPEVQRIGKPLGILGGFMVGGLVMIGLKWLVIRFERAEAKRHELPIGLAAAAAVDTFVDGAIISAGFATEQRLGALLTAALALELFFLTLSVGSEFQKSKKGLRHRGVIVTTAIALMLVVGALGAAIALRNASDATLAVVLSFGSAALIYLVAEELLVETIQAEDSLFPTAMLFAGFLILLALKLLSAGSGS